MSNHTANGELDDYLEGLLHDAGVEIPAPAAAATAAPAASETPAPADADLALAEPPVQAAAAPEAAAVSEAATAHAVAAVLSGHMAAMTGAQTDRMMRDDGWRLLSIGRHIERLGFLADALARGFDSGAVADEGGFEAIVALFDSTITFRAQYQLRHDVPALVDLLVLDPDNPRSLAWVAHTLRGRVRKLHGNADGGASPGGAPGPLGDAVAAEAEVIDPTEFSREALCAHDAAGRYPALAAMLSRCAADAWRLSDQLGARYFTHSGDQRQSLGS